MHSHLQLHAWTCNDWLFDRLPITPIKRKLFILNCNLNDSRWHVVVATLNVIYCATIYMIVFSHWQIHMEKMHESLKFVSIRLNSYQNMQTHSNWDTVSKQHSTKECKQKSSKMSNQKPIYQIMIAMTTKHKQRNMQEIKHRSFWLFIQCLLIYQSMV